MTILILNQSCLASETSDILVNAWCIKGTDIGQPLVSVDTSVQIYITQRKAEHSTQNVSEVIFHTSGKRSA
jgi:hypothetical protein